MGMLDQLLGGDGRQRFQDFAQRAQQPGGSGVSDEETMDRYGELAPQLSPQDYHASAQEAFSRLSPQERQEFATWLQQRAGQQGMSAPGVDLNDPNLAQRAAQDPGQLAQMTTQLHQSQPGMLEQLLGRGTGGAFDNPIAKMAFAGITAMAAQRLMGGMR